MAFIVFGRRCPQGSLLHIRGLAASAATKLRTALVQESNLRDRKRVETPNEIDFQISPIFPKETFKIARTKKETDFSISVGPLPQGQIEFPKGR